MSRRPSPLSITCVMPAGAGQTEIERGLHRSFMPIAVGRRLAGAAAEDDALEQRVAHHAVAPVGAAGDLAAGVDALERRRAVRVDHEAAVLVVEHRVGEDPLGERVDAGRRGSGAACTAARRRRPPPGSASCRGRPPGGRRASRRRARRDLVDDRLRDDVARPERVGELLAVGVQEHGAVGARRLGDRVALHVRRPRAAVRVVLERVEVARLGAEVERDPRHLAGRVRMVRRELAALLRLRVAAAAGARGRRSPPRSRARRTRARQPFSCGSRLRSGAFSKRRARAGLPGLAQRLRDRVARCGRRPGAAASASRRRSGRAGSRRSRA